MTGAHVLQLIDGLNVGGAEVLLRDLASGLLRRGYQVSVGYSTPGPLVQELENLDISLTRLPRLARVDPFLLARIIRLMRRERPQIVHTHLFKSDFHGRLAAKITGVPIVVSTLHNNDAWAQKKLLGSLYGATARYADRLIAVSAEVRDFQIRHTGVPAEKIVTIDNGVDLSRFAGQEEKGKKLRQNLGIAPSAPLFGIIGRLKPQKDHVTFLKAAAVLLQEQPNARFLIIGDGPLRAELEKMTKAMDLSSAAIFTGLRSDIPALLAAIDVLVLSSQWEGLPVTLLEGMAASRPVVATAVGGVPSVVLPDISAFLVPPEAPQELAQACLKLAKNPELRQRMGQAGYQRVAKKYSLDTMIDKTTAIYDELLRTRGLGNLARARSGDAA